jgi:hypothetical protein
MLMQVRTAVEVASRISSLRIVSYRRAMELPIQWISGSKPKVAWKADTQSEGWNSSAKPAQASARCHDSSMAEEGILNDSAK